MENGPESDPYSHEEAGKKNDPIIPGGWLRAILAFLSFLMVQGVFALISIGILVAVRDLSPQAVESALKSGNWPSLLLFHQAIGFLGTFLLVFFFRRVVEGKSLSSLGLNFKLRPLLLGMILGPLIMGVCVSILYATGVLGVSMGYPHFKPLAIYFLLTLIIALNEELLVRGYLLNNMMSSMRAPLALLISALLFAGLHAYNLIMTSKSAEMSTLLLAATNLFLAGLLLGVTYIRDQELAFPIGLHLSWNFAQGPLFGFNVSGLELSKGSVMKVWSKGASYWTGGDFGLEGSLLLIILQIILIPLLYRFWKNGQ